MSDAAVVPNEASCMRAPFVYSLTSGLNKLAQSLAGMQRELFVAISMLRLHPLIPIKAINLLKSTACTTEHPLMVRKHVAKYVHAFFLIITYFEYVNFLSSLLSSQLSLKVKIKTIFSCELW